jgi:non-ribosomal peptide synthetase component F
MALVAGVQALVYRSAGQEDFVMGSPVANRVRPELEGLIGFFVNTLPLRADLRGDPSFRQLLERVRETTLRAYDNQVAPLAAWSRS